MKLYRKKKRISLRGFTLVELMVTTVLVAIIVPAAIKGLTLVSALASQSVHRARALTLAESKLAELLATEEWASGNMEGDFAEWKFEKMPFEVTKDVYDIYTWNLIVSDVEGMKELEMTVKWENRGLERELTLTTWKLTQDVTK